jgi:catechol 2,3-dioxygenase-like lactoylglutathione lyase family enzyme
MRVAFQPMSRPRLVGINHVALDVGDVDKAVEFWSSLFDVRLRGRGPHAAFIDIGDQFIALMQGGGSETGSHLHRHFGLVVDDKDATRRLLQEQGIEIVPGRGLDFRDPWGNLIQVVQYDEVQFTKPDRILDAIGVTPDKTEQALAELRAKGLA